MAEDPIPDGAWKNIVQYMPIPSVDLLVIINGGIVLGKRENEPLCGEWFVPGGTVMKNERLETAAKRIATEELSSDVTILDRIGTYEHFYDTAEVDRVSSKHYVATAFVVEPEKTDFQSDEQHSEFRIFRPPFGDHHPYIRRYVSAIEDSWIA